MGSWAAWWCKLEDPLQTIGFGTSTLESNKRNTEVWISSFVLLWIILLLVSHWYMEHDWTARKRRWSLRFSSSNKARIVLDITDVTELENTSENHSVSLSAQGKIRFVYGTPDTLLNLCWKTFKIVDFMDIPHNRFQCFTISLLGTASWCLELSSLVET